MRFRNCGICRWLLGHCLAAPLLAALCATTLHAQLDVPALRRPAALALADGDRWLMVANHRSGTICVVDVASEQVVADHPIGRALADLKVLPDGRLLAVDEAAHQLLLLERNGSSLQTVGRLEVSPYPVSLAVSLDGRTAYVASLWSRRLSVVSIGKPEDDKSRAALHLEHSLPLPFAPREQLLAQEGRKLIVADSFGGRLAVIDTEQQKIESLRKLPGHNIRGLALDASGRKLLVSHQIINSLAETTENDIHWGIVLINVLRWLSLEKVMDPAAGILDDAHVHPAGDFNSAGGDPAGLAVLPDGTVLLALAGTNRLAWGKESDFALQSVAVGARPTRVAGTRDSRKAFVANSLDDSISVVDLPAAAQPRTISLGRQPELELADRGERLFYNASLSLDGWFSCHSCHTDGHTCGETVDNFGDDSYGAAKQVISLLGCGETGPWAWNGQVARLEHQVQNSIETTMQGQADDQDVVALAAYLRKLAPPPPVGRWEQPVAAATIEKGEKMFTNLRCAACHNPGHRYTSSSVYAVGLTDRLGNEHFNPPSLQGVSQRESFFHDNRANSLEDVFKRFAHGLDSLGPDGGLSDQALSDLVSFLRSL